ncbi:MAG: glycosyltransferase [Deltaproteobacteria bacterium]|nr:glycosyltransferase [Deltaproteobacteria bacterium]
MAHIHHGLTMSDFTKIALQMREDWNRRISHDYRFWMSESHVSDEEMWRSGERDLQILLDGISEAGKKTFLELGCGVGRLLKPALKYFGGVIGIDVSEKAVETARHLLGSAPNLELHAGDGYTLAPVQNESVDVAISFAAITSMPTDVAANYLLELHRVLKRGGILRMQLYLGEEQLVCRNDTLHLRCYKKEALLESVAAAGFELEWLRELVLPFQVSFKEIGIEAVIVSLRKSEAAPESAAVVSRLLLPQGEADGAENTSGADIECWMSVNYAKELAERGETERARQAVEYALSFQKSASIDVRDVIDRILNRIEESEQPAPTRQVSQSGVFEANMAVLTELFPKAAEQVRTRSSSEVQVEVKETPDGPVLYQQGICLDHPGKPKSAAASWAKRLVEDERYLKAAAIIVYGFGSGYHLEQLSRCAGGKQIVVEPCTDTFAQALKIRDLRAVLRELKGLHVGIAEAWDFLEPESELVVRPQTQALFGEHCSQLKAAFHGKRGFASLHPAIAVVGPMQGGTLPMTGYTLRGLMGLGQRTRAVDFSSFASGFHALEGFVFDKARQAHLQGHYIEMMSQVVLESINEKPVDIVICMAQAPLTGRALTELRKKGVITALWFVEDYLRFTYWREMAQYYDFVFTIQKGQCLDAIKAAGAANVSYLPVACDPDIHRPVSMSEEERKRWGSPISFVGAGYHNRQQLFAALCELPFKIWGTEWPGCKPFDRLVQEQGRRISPDEYVKIFNASDININLHSSSEKDGVDPTGDFVNPRTIELAAAGAFQLVDERSHLAELLTPGEEVATFNSAADLKEKIEYYLAHPDERKRIAEKGRCRVLREHTYQHRLKAMLSEIFSVKYEQLKLRQDRSPWQKMLKRSEPYPELLSRCKAAYQRGEEPNLDGLIADVVQGQGKLTETEQKLLFLYHVRKQIIRAVAEEGKQG